MEATTKSEKMGCDGGHEAGPRVRKLLWAPRSMDLSRW